MVAIAYFMQSVDQAFKWNTKNLIIDEKKVNIHRLHQLIEKYIGHLENYLKNSINEDTLEDMISTGFIRDMNGVLRGGHVSPDMFVSSFINSLRDINSLLFSASMRRENNIAITTIGWMRTILYNLLFRRG